MTEAERNSFFAHSTQRAPGKRQIKPTAAMEHLVLPAEEDEDDEDFKAELSGSGSESSSQSSQSGSDDDDDDNGEGDDEETDYLKSLKEDDEEEEESRPICSLCLNLRVACAKEEVMQCDKCGVAVHELCYGIDPEFGADDNSTDSASVTEPWFCEPCIHDLKEPPHCELCPVRYGALKRADVNGGWVHLLCALYTPGITFGDIERCGAISWQEIDYKQFGRKACNGCTNRLEARTGIVVGCDAALCRNFYHPTCAQRLGLLIDRTEEEHDQIVGDSEEYHDERLIHCKKHSHDEEVRKKKELYSIFVRQEERRFATMLKRKKLNEREEEKRKKMLERNEARFKRFEGVTISAPDVSWDKNDCKLRRARHLHTSSKYLDAFSNKAELLGVDGTEFEKAFIKVNGASLTFLPPSFSPEFVAYFNHREKHVMNSEKNRLEGILKEKERLKEKQEKDEQSYHKLEEEMTSTRSSLIKTQDRLTKLHNMLIQLGVKKIIKLNELMKKEPPLTPRSRLLSKSSVSSDGPSTSKHHRLIIKTCATCNFQRDQHLLCECDSCHKHYHLACLDPPLERMPKKVNCEWHCSECVPDSDSDMGDLHETSPELGISDNEDTSNNRRKLRHRSDSERKRKIQEKEDETRAYKSAILRGSNSKRVIRPRSIHTPPPQLVKSYRSSTQSITPPPILTPVPPPTVSPIITPDIDCPPVKRGRGRPRKTPSQSTSPDKSLTAPPVTIPLVVETKVSSPSPRRGRPPSLSPQSKRTPRVLHDVLDNGDEGDEQMETIVILKD